MLTSHVVRNDKATVEELNEMEPREVGGVAGAFASSECGNIDRGDHSTSRGRFPCSECVSAIRRLVRHSGAVVDHAGELKHGKTSMIEHDGKGVFEGLPNPFEAVRYHSLAVQPDAVPPGFEVSARSAESGVIMGMRHPDMPIEGVQFHPESILTRPGKDLLRNFLEMEN